MTIQENIRKELLVRLSEGEYLMNKYEESPAEFAERDKRILYRLQIEIELLIKLYDDNYDELDDDTWELADKITLAEV